MAEQKTKVIISAEDKTRAGIDSVKSNLGQLESKFNTLSGVVGRFLPFIGAATITGVLINATKEAANFADEMGKAAQKVGTTTERLSELKFAGELSDVNFEQLQNGLGKLAKTAEDFRNNSKTAVDAFGKLKIDPTQYKDTADLFDVVVEKLSAMEDGARKTAIAQEIFGKSGRELIPLINSGAEGLREAAEEARAFGVVVTQEAVKSAEQFNDNLTRLETAGRGLSIELGNRLIPGLVEVTNKMVQASKEGGVLKGIIVGIGAAIKTLTLGTDETQRAEKIQELSQFITFQKKQLAEISKNSNKEVVANLQAKIDEAIEERKRLIQIQSERYNQIKPESKASQETEIFDPKTSKTSSRTSQQATQAVRDYAALYGEFSKILDGTNELSKAEQTLRDIQAGRFSDLLPWQQEQLAGLAEEVRLKEEGAKADELALAEQEKMFKDAADAEQARIEAAERAAIAQSAIYDDLDKQIEQLKFQAELEGLSAKEKEAKLTAYEKEILYQETLNRLIESGAEYNADDLEKIRDKTDQIVDMKRKFEDTNSAAKDIGLTLKSAAEDAIVNFESVGDVIQSLAQDIERILVRRTITEKLVGGIDSWLSEIFPFADGGIMSGAGPLPLKKYATGGVANSPQLALYGEGSMNEAIVPLPDGRSIPVTIKQQMQEVRQAATNVQVNIINAPSQPKVETKTDGRGNQSINVIFDAIKNNMIKDIASEGPLAQILQNQYGLNRNSGAY